MIVLSVAYFLNDPYSCNYHLVYPFHFVFRTQCKKTLKVDKKISIVST